MNTKHTYICTLSTGNGATLHEATAFLDIGNLVNTMAKHHTREANDGGVTCKLPLVSVNMTINGNFRNRGIDVRISMPYYYCAEMATTNDKCYTCLTEKQKSKIIKDGHCPGLSPAYYDFIKSIQM